MPLKPPFGTAMWKVMVQPLTLPCSAPFPIMPRPLSLMFNVPVMALPFWVRVQVMVSGPLVSDDGPAHVPDRLVSVPLGLGVGPVGADVLPPHAVTVTRLRMAGIQARILQSPSDWQRM